MATRKRKEIMEFGDFQTPPRLAEDVCRTLVHPILSPATIIEPTCGVGNFLAAALEVFPNTKRVLGVDINHQYIAKAIQQIQGKYQKAELIQGDFFSTKWKEILQSCEEPILVIGNPPWVTNTHLSKLNSSNSPEKSNHNGLSGYDAISGKSNFDISEWMLTRIFDWLSGRRAVLAMLCKTSVARKVLLYAWKSGVQIQRSNMHLIDAQDSFGVAVDACLLSSFFTPGTVSNTCKVFSNLKAEEPDKEFGFVDGHLVADIEKFHHWRSLIGPELYRWRSGIKHDCSAVMELRSTIFGNVNGMHEHVEIEEDYLFPFFKSSDIANNRIANPKRYLLVPQRRVGEDTRIIRHVAPKTWHYLEAHATLLDNRKSAIYTRQPRFSVFGVGDYTFAPWKVAVSGLYKQLDFHIVPSFKGKPSVLDDTCYFLGCHSEEEAHYIKSLLDSEPAQALYSSMLFTDAKRPITVDLLRRLDFRALACILGSENRIDEFQRCREAVSRHTLQRNSGQIVLFG